MSAPSWSRSSIVNLSLGIRHSGGGGDGGKVGLMHDSTMSRDYRDNKGVLTKSLMALAKHQIWGRRCARM